jgi:hypothetical protein
VPRDVERDASAASLISVPALPLYVRDLIFLGHVDPDGSLGGVEGAGAAAVGLYVALLAAGGALVVRRTREVAT